MTLDEIKKIITGKDTMIDALMHDNTILIEAIVSATDALNELRKITSTYHKKILLGQATIEDVKTCSSIVQRAIKHDRVFEELKALYIKNCMSSDSPPPPLGINIIEMSQEAEHEKDILDKTKQSNE